MREIKAAAVTEAVAALCIEANAHLPADVEAALAAARAAEPWPLAKHTLGLLEKNLEMADQCALPICQDTGMAVVFAELGQEVHIDGDFEAAVNEGVNLCRERGKARAAGLVNGVLRRIAENRDSIPPVPGAGAAEYLSTRYSHPLWLVRELVSRRGYDGAEALLAANNAEPPLTIQTNTLKTTPDALAAALSEAGYRFESGLCAGSFDLAGAGSVERIPGYAGGLFYVQDAAARMAVESIGLKPGMSVLDACSAPGGKSFAAAMLMRGEGRILACDLKEKRLRRVCEGAARLGIDMIDTRTMDARAPSEELHEAFDVVIADAPCSGFGVVRRKAEIRFKSRAEIEPLPEIQLGILRAMAGCVKPGGTLLYSTCTLLARENEDVAAAFLGEHGEFTVAEERTLWPDTDKTDGFFICRMVKST